MAEELAGVDLAITVDASPDCRHQSFPACLLKDLLDQRPRLALDTGLAGRPTPAR